MSIQETAVTILKEFCDKSILKTQPKYNFIEIDDSGTPKYFCEVTVTFEFDEKPKKLEYTFSSIKPLEKKKEAKEIAARVACFRINSLLKDKDLLNEKIKLDEVTDFLDDIKDS